MQLIEIKEIKGQITLKSGLHIGSGDVEMRIGGTDNPVIKHPYTQEPYIPGSSLKGKIRSLLEMRSGLAVKSDGNPIQPKDLKGLAGHEKEDGEKILKIFGSSGAESDDGSIGPTRVSFADCPLNENWKKDARANRFSFIEVKSENSINRINGTAQNPRFTERVPADTKFDFSVRLKILSPAEEDLVDFLLEGLKLLELDALGGSGSRGYGRIAFDFDDEAIRNRFEGINPFGKQGGGRATI